MAETSASIRVRKEVRELTPTEWAAYANAVATANSQGWVAWYAHQVDTNFSTTTGNAMFLPFRRKLVADFENRLRAVDPTVGVPYWDVSRDASNPAASEVLTSAFAGGNGDASQGNTVATAGRFGPWTLAYPTKHALTRRFNAGDKISPWSTSEFVTSALQTSTTYDDLRRNLENTVNGQVHIGIGGDMSTTSAPNDPIYWLHVANLDRLWALWQSSNPTRVRAYDGVNSSGRPAVLTDTMPVYDVPVASVMDTAALGYCYSAQSS
ncbi:tyrosinase family protein [Streptomyces sp. NPDC004520]|uniref:tyrosinase family protein n=1 Tax=Streptomyces sp. NPDC004520 TaxID=3364702 RepID=UPI0036816834